MLAINCISETIAKRLIMTTNTTPETIQFENPADTLRHSIEVRHERLTYLSDALAQGINLVSNLEAVNDVLSVSPRPDLVLEEPVSMMPLENPNNLRRINNFVPNWTEFGVRIYEGEEETYFGSNRMQPKCVGRRPLTAEEKEVYFNMGARGDYNEHLAFAEAAGIDPEIAKDVITMTHVNVNAFMRMWVLLPELTETLMNLCLDEPGTRKRINEEIFVAYSLMSRLVDRTDRGAIKDDGSIDTWLLCH